jgi:hypothetical protein
VFLTPIGLASIPPKIVGVRITFYLAKNAYQTPIKRLPNAYQTPIKRLPNAYQTPIICRVAAFRCLIGVLTPMGMAGNLLATGV